MKSFIRTLLTTLAIGFTLLPEPGFAKGMNPAFVANRLDQIVHLTANQRAQAVEIFTKENADLQAIPSVEDRLVKGMPIRQATREKIRALLTPEQQQIYDNTPQSEGGGQTTSPVNMTERIDRTVTLTDEQTLQVAAIYAQEARAIQSLTPEERASKGVEIGRSARAQVRALLTPEQQKKWNANPTGAEDLAEKAYIKNFIMSSPEIAAQVGTVAKATLSGSMLGSNNLNPPSKGRYTYLVVGSMSSETLKIYWERPFPGAPLTIIRIVRTDDTNSANVQFENDFWQVSGSSNLTISADERSTAHTHP